MAEAARRQASPARIRTASSNGWLLLALFLAAFAIATPSSTARADDTTTDAAVPEAAKQFDAGKQAFRAKKYVQAALAFEAAASLRPHPLALYSAALAWEQADRPERAADDFGRSLKLEGLSAQDQAHAKERLEALERSLGTILVSGPSNWSAQLENPPALPLPARLHGSPGVHTMAVVIPDRPVQRRDVSLEVGKTVTLELKDEPAPSTTTAPPVTAPTSAAPPPPPPPPVVVEEGVSPRRAIGLTMMGLGVAGIGAGIVLGLETLDARDTYNAGPTQALVDHVRSLEKWTNIAFIAGGALTIGGGLLVFWPSGGHKEAPAATLQIAPTVGGAVLRGRF